MSECENCGKRLLDNLVLTCLCNKTFCSASCSRIWHNKQGNINKHKEELEDEKR